MSILSRIRDNIGLVAVIIFIALLAFILTDFVSGVTSIFGGPPTVGVVDGKKIRAQEFSARFTNALNNMGDQGNEQVRFQIMDQVWEQMVGEVLFQRQYESLGLEISGEEVYAMFTREPVHPIVRQYFMAPDQPFDPNEMKRRLEQIANDPELRPQLQEFEKYLLESRAQDQFKKLVEIGYTGSRAAARAKYTDQNRRVSLAWVSVPYTTIPDSAVKVTDSELRSYINKNIARYKQKEDEVTITFAQFAVKPSVADTQKAFTAALKTKETFAATTDDSMYVATRSREPFNPTPKTLGAFPASIHDSLRLAAKGTVIGPVMDGRAFRLYKVIDIQSGAVSAKVNHILFLYRNDTTASLAKASEVRRRLTASNFATLAAENTDDFQSRAKGGALGWIDLDTYGDNFKKAVQAAAPGSIIGPVKGMGGWHLIQVVEKTTNTYVVGEVEQDIFYTTETDKSVFREANQFAAKAQQTGNLENAALERKIETQTSNPLTPNSKMISGLSSGRELVLWAVKANVGDFSPVMKVGDAYVVAQVSRRRNEGARDLEDVRDEVTLRLTNEKKAKIITDKLKAAGGADLVAIQAAYGAGATQGSAQDITFESVAVPGLGSEYAVIGKAFALEKGKLSNPIVGANAVYIIQVTDIAEIEQPEDAVVENLLVNDRVAQVRLLGNSILEALKEIGKVKDTRYRAGY